MNVRKIAFEISTYYDEREIEDLLETLENRGAIYRRFYGPKFSLYVPKQYDPLPFLKTLEECGSITNISFRIQETETSPTN